MKVVKGSLKTNGCKVVVVLKKIVSLPIFECAGSCHLNKTKCSTFFFPIERLALFIKDVLKIENMFLQIEVQYSAHHNSILHYCPILHATILSM